VLVSQQTPFDISALEFKASVLILKAHLHL